MGRVALLALGLLLVALAVPPLRHRLRRPTGLGGARLRRARER